jgi:hypothetical protein
MVSPIASSEFYSVGAIAFLSSAGKVKHDPMGWITQEGSPGLHGLKNATFPFDSRSRPSTLATKRTRDSDSNFNFEENRALRMP